MSHPYGIGLDKNAANFVALSPLSFLERSAGIYPEHLAVVHGARRFNWRQTYARCRQLASALVAAGVGKNDTVAVMLANTPEMYESHFGVPMTGAVLNAINTRLDAETVAFILNHGEAKVLITDREFSPVVRAALARVERPLLVIDVFDSEYLGEGERVGSREYEEFIATGAADFAWQLPEDEWDAIALNYTSGTTGNPKGVVVHHRGAYLGALSNLISWGMPPQSVYLWTLPMFHCNGWCFPWAMAANSGTNVCLRKVDAQLIFQAIREHKVSHYCGAPIVQALLINAPAEQRAGIEHEVATLVAGAAPPVAIIEGMSQMGFDLTHVYGLTETYGPSAVCAKHGEWQALDLEEQARLNSRQGVPYHCQEGISVRDPETMLEVPRDSETMGEIMFRGNLVMKGYLKNPTATEESFAGGWYHTGDLAVMHPDGYAKIKDRSKDIIISGGENISSIEVEDVLYRHPSVMAAAVVATPDDKWGEVPCAFLELREGHAPTAEALRDFCLERMAR
ncbi:MAG TPA: acyl-CoA synthetase, partial [Pseudomonas sp.]|nr:acyl-CoA synthetase [Pseudomonas sp.]